MLHFSRLVTYTEKPTNVNLTTLPFKNPYQLHTNTNSLNCRQREFLKNIFIVFHTRFHILRFVLFFLLLFFINLIKKWHTLQIHLLYLNDWSLVCKNQSFRLSITKQIKGSWNFRTTPILNFLVKSFSLLFHTKTQRVLFCIFIFFYFCTHTK